MATWAFADLRGFFPASPSTSARRPAAPRRTPRGVPPDGRFPCHPRAALELTRSPGSAARPHRGGESSRTVVCYPIRKTCFYSSDLGGKRGTRECVHPCRRLYGHGGEPTRSSRRGTCRFFPRLRRSLLGSRLEIEGASAGPNTSTACVGVPRRARRNPRGEARGRRRGGDADPVRGIGGRRRRGGRPGPGCARWRPGRLGGNVGDLLGTVGRVDDGWSFVPGAAPVSPATASGSSRRGRFRPGFSPGPRTRRSMGVFPEGPFSVSAGDLLFRTAGGGRPELTRRRAPGDGGDPARRAGSPFVSRAR